MEHFSRLRRGCAMAAGLLFFATAHSAAADPIATVLAIDGVAQGPQGSIEVGDRLDDGLVIQTNGNTKMELRFDDGTLMAVGPNSELEISSVLMNSGGQANRFAINAATGSFRFLSGDSNRDAYEITTPASTIGIRGTEFDILVDGDITAVVLYQGALELCLTDSDRCWAFRGSCYLAEADLGRDRVRGLRPPEARGYLNNFIYSQSQARLSQALHVNINACAKYLRENDNGPEPAVEEVVEDTVEEPVAEEEPVLELGPPIDPEEVEEFEALE